MAEVYKVLGYVLTGLDIASDWWFIHAIKVTYDYGEKIYDNSQVDHLEMARNAAIVFAIIGILLTFCTCCYYGCKKNTGYNADKVALTAYNGWTFTVVDVPMIVIVFYMSFKSGTITPSGMVSIGSDILIWLYKGYNVTTYNGGLFSKTYLPTFWENFSATWNWCGALILGIALLILAYEYDHSTDENMSNLALFAEIMGWIFLVSFCVAFVCPLLLFVIKSKD
eukprot:389021_1